MADSGSMEDEPMVGVQLGPGDTAEDSSDLSSDDSSSDEADIAPEQLEKLSALETELNANINLYEKHVEYIELLRQMKLRDRLRQAHERMALKFPLSEHLWLDWINDELETVSSTEDVERIKGLWRRATQDYLSVELWAQHLDFLSSLDPDVSGYTAQGIQAMRSACEAALTAAGLHVSQGGRLWAIFRDYEKAVLQSMGEVAGKERDKQEERVRSLYTRQLQVPLAGNQEVLDEYKAWEEAHGKSVQAHVLKGAEKARDEASLRASYEDAVAGDKEPDAALLAAYLSYVKLEQAQGDPARVQVVLERAVAAFPVTVELWFQYCRYLEEKLHQLPAVLARVAARAARNCYWSGKLWATALRAADRAGQSLEDISALSATALAAGLQSQEDYLEVLLTQLDAIRHQTPTSSTADAAASPAGQALRAAFQHATNVMEQYFPDQPDRMLRLPSYWAHCELHVFGDVAAARHVWEAALKTQLAKFAEVWLLYASMEQWLRNVKEARSLYKKAVGRKLEASAQYLVCVDWLNFERKDGSAEDYAQALSKVAPILDEYESASVSANVDQQTTATAQAAARKAAWLTPKEQKARRQANDPNFKGGKANKAAAKAAKAVKGDGKRPADTDVGQQVHKKARTQGPDAAHQQDTGLETGQGLDTEMQDAGQDDTGAEEQHISKKGEYYDLEHSVFVRGLPPDVQPEALRQFFSDCGHIVAVRIPRFEDGTYRNFGYVDFNTDEAVSKAEQKSGSQLPGTDCFLTIAKSAPPGRGGRGRGRGRARGGRFAGDPNQQGRGAKQDGHDQEQHGGRGRGRGRGHEPYRGANKLLGLGYAGRNVNIRHPHQHLQLNAAAATPGGVPSGVPSTSLLPRSVALAKRDTKGQEGGAAPMDTEAEAKPMSNSDFRAMLLSGKK